MENPTGSLISREQRWAKPLFCGYRKPQWAINVLADNGVESYGLPITLWFIAYYSGALFKVCSCAVLSAIDSTFPSSQTLINLCINLEQVQLEISSVIHSSVQAQMIPQ